MRIAIVSDIHGNRTALEAVLADLRDTSPDLIFHGGDLADAGSDGAFVVDRIRDLGWPGVIGNTDEMLASPQVFEEFAAARPQLEAIWAATREMAAVTRDALGEERLAWLRTLPRAQVQEPVALVHASPDTAWRAPAPEASDDELHALYAPLDCAVAVYGHLHRPFVRAAGGLKVCNSGSVGLAYDGDPRASYLLVDDGVPSIRRVAYDLDREIAALAGFPRAEWIAKILRTAAPQMP
jgi:putative phosphoesterase